MNKTERVTLRVHEEQKNKLKKLAKKNKCSLNELCEKAFDIIIELNEKGTARIITYEKTIP